MFSSSNQQHSISSSSICPENSTIKSIIMTNGSTDDLSSTTNDDDNGSIRWLDFELFDRISIQTQTLEEIMNEKTEFLLDEESEELFGGLSPFPPPYGAETTCSSIADVNMPKILPMGRYGSVPTELPKSYKLDSPLVLRREDTISQQINTKTQTKYCHLTSLCIGKRLLSVGTSQGVCLIFEKEGSQKLLHSVQSGDSSFGSISCMDFSMDQTRLAVGFSTGALLIFATNTKGNTNKFIFKSNDVVQPGRGLIHLKYITSNVLLIVDNGGNVYEFHEKRRLNRRKDGNVRCIFTGCKGEVLNISFVHSSDKSVELLVLATFHQVFLLSVKRRGAAVGQLRLHGSSLSPPLIDWRERIVQPLSNTRSFSLRLCIARDNEARLYQVRQRVGGDLLFPILQILKFSTPLINLKWIDDWSLLALCTTENNTEQLQLVEIPQFSSSERKNLQNQQSTIPTFSVTPSVILDISESVKLVYNSVDFKGLATGCNVSKAMLVVADSVCYHTFIRHPDDNHLYLLGADALFRLQLIEQNEQLDSLIERSDYCSALMFVVDICCGKIANRTTTTITTTNFRANAFRRIPDLVGQLLEQTMDGIDSGHIDELIVHYKRNFHVLIRACVLTSHFNLLYDTIYSNVQKDSLCRSTFLEMLEEFILENALDQPPPSLVNDYLNYLLSEGQIPQFEQSVIRLPVESLDLHQVMSACREHQLFDATCYVLNNAMRDYITPLNEQFELLHRFVHKQVLSDHEIVQGNKLLLYLSCCLAGRAYPYGDLPDENLTLTVPLETYKFIVQLRSSFSSSSRSPSPQNINTKSIEFQSFPHLNILLKFDAQQFFNVISTCADAPVFAKCEGRLKRLVDMLISKCVEEEDENDDIDLINELGPLLITFINGLLQKGAIPKDVYLLTKLIERVFLRRAFPSLRIQKVAEQSTVELLRLVPEIDLNRILEIAQPVPYIHICAYIFTVRREYVKLLECFLADPLEPLNVFPTMVDLLNTLREVEQQESLRQFVRQKLERLCLLDSQKTAEFVLSNFPELLMECRSTPKKLPLSFLNNCFRIRREQNFKTLTGGEEEQDELLFDYFFEETIKQQKSEFELLDAKLVDELRYWLPLGSFSDYCLNVAMQQPNGLLVECSALLLLSRGHISRAFEHLFNEGILNKCSQSCVNSLLELTATYPTEAHDGGWLSKLFRHLLNTSVQTSGKSDDPFSHLLGPDSQLSRVFTAIMELDDGRINNNNSKQQIPIISLIGELFSHKSFQNAKFSSSFKNLLRQMLLWCDIRLVMQRSTRNCVRRELTEKWTKIALKKGAFAQTIILPNKSTSTSTTDQSFPSSSSSNNQNNNQPQIDPLLLRCYCCDQRILKSFYLFACGHAMHLECIDESLERKRCSCEGENIENNGELNNKYFEDGESSSSSSDSSIPPLERLRRRKQKEAAKQKEASALPKITNQERQTVSAIFRELENAFQLNTGPPPISPSSHLLKQQSQNISKHGSTSSFIPAN